MLEFFRRPEHPEHLQHSEPNPLWLVRLVEVSQGLFPLDCTPAIWVEWSCSYGAFLWVLFLGSSSHARVEPLSEDYVLLPLECLVRR